MKVLCIHAHYDDFEFVAGGTFELWRQKWGESFRARVIVCTDGKAGHHFRTREETGRIRLQEQRASAEIGGYEFEPLKLPDGQMPREACLQVSTPLLASLWKSIRAYEPDYLFCPPVPADPLAGVHVDHVAVAEAVRRVAYMINVPHAFTPEYPTDEAASKPCEPTWCHQSQISEWLPWVGRHDLKPPASLAEWTQALRRRFENKNRELGIQSQRPLELFTVTSWGAVPSFEQLVRDFPNIVSEASHLDRLKARL